MKLSYHKPRRPKTVIIRPSKPAQLPAKQIVESLTQTLRTAPHMVSVGEESVTEWSSSSLRLDMPSVVKMADGLQPPLGVSLRSPLVAEPSLEPQACHAQLTSELLPALLLCCEAELGQHWPEVDKLLCIWFKTQSSGEFERVCEISLVCNIIVTCYWCLHVCIWHTRMLSVCVLLYT